LTALRLCRHRARFNKSKTQCAESVNVTCILIEAGSETNAVGKAQFHERHTFVRPRFLSAEQTQ